MVSSLFRTPSDLVAWSAASQNHFRLLHLREGARKALPWDQRRAGLSGIIWGTSAPNCCAHSHNNLPHVMWSTEIKTFHIPGLLLRVNIVLFFLHGSFPFSYSEPLQWPICGLKRLNIRKGFPRSRSQSLHGANALRRSTYRVEGEGGGEGWSGNRWWRLRLWRRGGRATLRESKG